MYESTEVSSVGDVISENPVVFVEVLKTSEVMWVDVVSCGGGHGPLRNKELTETCFFLFAQEVWRVVLDEPATLPHVRYFARLNTIALHSFCNFWMNSYIQFLLPVMFPLLNWTCQSLILETLCSVLFSLDDSNNYFVQLTVACYMVLVWLGVCVAHANNFIVLHALKQLYINLFAWAG